MKYDPQKHHRRSIRLKGYDYHNAGAYFVTICTKNRECVLDDPIANGIINDVWLALPLWFPTIELDEFVVMPNHTHFVIWNNVGTPLASILDAGNADGGAQNADGGPGDSYSCWRWISYAGEALSCLVSWRAFHIDHRKMR